VFHRFRYLALLSTPYCSFQVHRNINCNCTNCRTNADKCARRGCSNRKADGLDFCYACQMLGRAKPSTTCDNLTALAASN
jgi:hypothetical protein